MRPTRKPRLVLVFLLALCALFVYGYTARMQGLGVLQTEIVAMQGRIDHAQQEQQRLTGELRHFTSPDYLEQTAREDFDSGREGDVVIVPIKPGSAEGSTTGGMAVPAVGAEATAVFDPHDLPVWQQWATFFATNLSTAR